MSPTAGGTTAAGHLGPVESWNIKGPEIVETFLRNDSATMNPQPPETTGDGANWDGDG